MTGKPLTWSEVIQQLWTRSEGKQAPAPMSDPVFALGSAVSGRDAPAAPSWRINTAGNCCVSTTQSFLPIDKNTPKGVKMLLHTQGGVAVVAIYHGEDFWRGWAPLPNTSNAQ